MLRNLQQIRACYHSGTDAFCMDLQETSSFPNVTASVFLATYSLASFDSNAQAEFGNKVLSYFNTSSANIVFNFTNVRDGSITFDFAAVFTDGKESDAREFGAILLVRSGLISHLVPAALMITAISAHDGSAGCQGHAL